MLERRSIFSDMPGEVAYEAGTERVTDDHVRQAQQHAEKDRFRELVNGAPTQAKAALLAITELSVNTNDDAFLTSRVYDQYERICDNLDIDILSVRRFRDILKEQAFLGVVEIEKINKGSAGGIHLPEPTHRRSADRPRNDPRG